MEVVAVETLRKDVIWDTNERQEGGVKSAHAGIIVFPSAIGQQAPTGDCATRQEMPRKGDLETCVLVKHPTSKVYTAYPLADGYWRIEMPGYLEPMAICWRENEQQPGNVMSTLVLDNFNTYFRIYPHTDWGYKPKPGETTTSMVRWFHPSTGLDVGHAYSTEQGNCDLEVVATGNVMQIGNTSILIVPMSGGYQVTAHETNGKIVIELTPDS